VSRIGGGKGPSLAQFGSLKEAKGQDYQVFISHSGEQKRGFVDFLEAEFANRYPDVKVFLDEYCLKPGDHALKEIHAAMQDAHVGEWAQGWVRPKGCTGSYSLSVRHMHDQQAHAYCVGFGVQAPTSCAGVCVVLLACSLDVTICAAPTDA
jgi:hypothetical protein